MKRFLITLIVCFLAFLPLMGVYLFKVDDNTESFQLKKQTIEIESIKSFEESDKNRNKTKNMKKREYQSLEKPISGIRT